MPRREKKYHYIYKTICVVTGKYYVGMHSTDNLEDGYLGSGKILGYSRRKHGDENHKKEIIEMCPSRSALKLREKELVNETMLADPLNMNLKYGGEGGWDHVTNQSAAGKIGVQVTNSRYWTSEKRTACLHRQYASGRQPVGWSAAARVSAVSPTANAKRSETMRIRGSQSGLANSQYGTCWVCDRNGPQKIKKDLLDEYLSRGFIKGRTMEPVV